jgi:hypothetical protein
MGQLLSLIFCRMLWSGFGWVKNKELLVGLRWAKEGVEVYQDLGGLRSGAGGMVDKEASIIRKNERVGS